MKALEQMMGIPLNSQKHVVRGCRGMTLLHPKIAVRFGQWLDVRFAVWCDLMVATHFSRNRCIGQEEPSGIHYRIVNSSLADSYIISAYGACRKPLCAA
jgi:hypothetical protein